MSNKIRVSILQRNKRVKRLQIQPTRNSFEFQGGVYMLSSDIINLDEKLEAEVFYFEENPTPIYYKVDDRSGDYLNELLRINFIEQVDNVTPYRRNILGDLLKIITNPQVMIGLILGASILYSLIESGGLALW